ncbi:MAG: T9SS type A sorting domain-containing protein [Ignavibacteria bacterium]
MKRFFVLLYVITYCSSFAQWNPYYLPYQGIANALDFYGNNGVAAGHTLFPFNEQLYVTTDFGSSWILSTYPPNLRALTAVQFVNSVIVYAGGAENLPLNTSVKIDKNFSCLPFHLKATSQMKGIDGSYNEYKASFIKSSNGGISWIKIGQFDTTTGYINDIQFFNENTGFAIIDSGSLGNSRVLKTTNGGLNWIAISIEPYLRLSRIYFLNPTTGFVCGDRSDTNLLSGLYGIVFKTTDGGVSWNSENFLFTNSMVDVVFLNSNTGFMLGNGNWNGYVNESGAKIYKTTNGGAGWDSTQFVYSVIPTAIRCIQGSEIAYAIGYYYDFYQMVGKITTMKTTNGGISWNIKFLNEDVYVIGLSLVNENIFFMSGGQSGQQAVVYKSTNGGTKIKNIGNLIPEYNKLYQNYPNPFNPATRIKFAVSSLEQIYLSVYDILGHEVRVIVNERLTPGIYEVGWNAKEFPSGIYYYRLKVGNYTETKKMLLLK